jgi:hypothetical protein
LGQLWYALCQKMKLLGIELQQKKRILAGDRFRFEITMNTPTETGEMFYNFSMVDAYNRSFGQELMVCISVKNIVEKPDEEDESAFDEPHEADKKYPGAIEQLNEMGIPVTEHVKDQIVKHKGKIQLLISTIMNE